MATRGYRWLFDHPTHDRSTGPEFVTELERQGLRVGPRWLTRLSMCAIDALGMPAMQGVDAVITRRIRPTVTRLR